MMWLILILVMFLPPAVLVYQGKEAKLDEEKQKEYYQLAIVYLVASFVIYALVLINY